MLLKVKDKILNKKEKRSNIKSDFERPVLSVSSIDSIADNIDFVFFLSN